MTDSLTFKDFKQRINIRDLLVDAGYSLNPRDGLRYPSYIRYGSDGRRIHGDKFIITANGLCCFQPPERRNYNIISFITEHPTLFRDYTPGMNPHRLVHLVCRRMLNEPVEQQEARIVRPEREQRRFTLDDYTEYAFDVRDMETQKRFYPYFAARGIDLPTQRAFADHFLLASQQKSDGRTYTNLCFPLNLPSEAGWKSGIVGMEERGKPNADGKSYKGMAAGSDAQRGLWIAQPMPQTPNLSPAPCPPSQSQIAPLTAVRNAKGHSSFGPCSPSREGVRKLPISEAKDVYWFESAFDAMAFYQLHPDNDAVYVSTGGNPSTQQVGGMLAETPRATHHLCFDRDRAGQMFALNFAMQKDGRTFTSHISPKGSIVVTDMTSKFERYTLDLVADGDAQAETNFHRVCGILGLKQQGLKYEPAEYPNKDWNEQLINNQAQNLAPRARGR